MVKFSSFIAAVGLAFALGATAASAEQTCEPACGSSERCVCTCAGTQTSCDAEAAPADCDCRCECKD